MRGHKRPIVTYTQVLNNLTDEEWKSLKLPPTSTISPKANLQLADLSTPSFKLTAAWSNVEETRGVLGVAGDMVKEGQVSLCHSVCYAGLGGSQVCVMDDDGDVLVSGDGDDPMGDEVVPKLVEAENGLSFHTGLQVPFNTEASQFASNYSSNTCCPPSPPSGVHTW